MKLQNSFILIPGFGEKTEQKLWSKGITNWKHLYNTSQLTRNKRQKARNFVEKAEKNLKVENTVFFKQHLPSGNSWRMYRNFHENACFFDIETTGLDKKKNKVTTVSFYRKGESKTLVRGQNLTQENLEKEIFDSSILVSFNGKMFDQPFLEQNFELNIETPHLDLMHMGRKVGLSGGLKNIEKQLGIDRSEVEDVDGREAVRLWKKYENKGDEAALNKLVTYNQYDAENLKRLADIVHERLVRKFYNPHLDE